jgi:hypothetical protein
VLKSLPVIGSDRHIGGQIETVVMSMQGSTAKQLRTRRCDEPAPAAKLLGS